MNDKNKKLALLLSTTVCLSTSAKSNTIPNSVEPFPYQSLQGWEERSFVGNTMYELLNENGTNILKATTISAASVLYKEGDIDLTKTPWLDWTWRINSTYQNIDERTKEGDDFPARLYVVAKIGFLPWETIAMNYVWSSHQPVNSAWANPYTKKTMMVAVQSGEQEADQWVSQKRNVVDDFKQYFNVDVKKLSGYAVMVDGDNSLQSGTAYFGNIDFQND